MRISINFFLNLNFDNNNHDISKMKKFLFTAVILALSSLASSAQGGFRFTEASSLNIIGKLFNDTPNPYHRVDTCRFKGFTKGENEQVRCSAGLAVLFSTNSSAVSVKSEYGYVNNGTNTMGIALRGYDLYIMRDGEWIYAASGAADSRRNTVLIKDLPEGEKQCMLHLPIYSEMYSVLIGTDEDAWIKPLESPFRHRVAIFGSSYTQGISISRPGMSYPMQFMRNTGIQLLSLGCSGNCKLQPYFADVLAAADVDAIIFDAFSNPGPEMIRERLFPFIERIQESHPDIPLIFMKSIYRENRNFSTANDRSEQAKADAAEEMMAEAVRRYDNVYYVDSTDTGGCHDSTVDGNHPSDMGYKAWAESIEKPVMKILAGYGIR